MSLGTCKAKPTMLAHLNIMHFNKFLGGDDMHWSTIPVNDDTSGIFFLKNKHVMLYRKIFPIDLCVSTLESQLPAVFGEVLRNVVLLDKYDSWEEFRCHQTFPYLKFILSAYSSRCEQSTFCCCQMPLP